MSESVDTTLRTQDEVRKPTEHERYDRYPGPRSFADNDIDRRLFFGREQEIDHLLHRVRASRLLVLFGKSGLGKTSLLQAGLYPRLRERGLLPVPVRLNQPHIAPVDAILEALRVTCQTHQVDYEPPKTEGLWEFFKTTDLWSGDILQTPVLVFDQFEELFTLQSNEARAPLASELGDLAARGLPTRIRQRLQAGEQARHSDIPPEVKVILSLREEYVGALEDLVPNLPAIFEQRFRLAPLNQELARRAVVEPAELDEPEVFATRPFRYTHATLDVMMEFLVNRQGEVEPFQLQIVCQHAEQQVARRQREGAGDVQVDETILGGRKGMEALQQNFYRNALRGFASWRQRSLTRRLCEVGLLSPEGHRVSMEQGQIRKQYGVRDNSLQKLSDARLIRKESRPGLEGFYYELSHDSVAGAVERSRRFRVPTIVKIGFGLLLLLATGVFFLLKQETAVQRQAAQAAEQQAKAQLQVSQAAKQLAEAQLQVSQALEQLAQAKQQLTNEKGKAAEPAVRGGGAARVQPPEAQRQTAQAAQQLAEAERRAAEAKKKLAVVERRNLAKEERERGAYDAALSELNAARALDPANAEIAAEIDKTRRSCNAEKRLGGTDLKC